MIPPADAEQAQVDFESRERERIAGELIAGVRGNMNHGANSLERRAANTVRYGIYTKVNGEWPRGPRWLEQKFRFRHMADVECADDYYLTALYIEDGDFAGWWATDCDCLAAEPFKAGCWIFPMGSREIIICKHAQLLMYTLGNTWEARVIYRERELERLRSLWREDEWESVKAQQAKEDARRLKAAKARRRARHVAKRQARWFGLAMTCRAIYEAVETMSHEILINSR
jgi:hypothetical protein